MEGIRCAVKVFALSREPLSIRQLKQAVSCGGSDDMPGADVRGDVTRDYLRDLARRIGAESAPEPAPRPAITLNADQERARDEIMASHKAGVKRYVLTGYAGTGKTTLMQVVADVLPGCVVTAPTHKAVQVLATKLAQAGLGVHSMTIHSLLGLKPAPDGEKTTLKRGTQGWAQRRGANAPAMLCRCDEGRASRGAHWHAERLTMRTPESQKCERRPKPRVGQNLKKNT